jgi:hypothetical protein
VNADADTPQPHVGQLERLEAGLPRRGEVHRPGAYPAKHVAGKRAEQEQEQPDKNLQAAPRLWGVHVGVDCADLDRGELRVSAVELSLDREGVAARGVLRVRRG